MMKKLIISLFVLVTVFALTGCTNSSKENNKKNSLVSGTSCKKELDKLSLEYITEIENEKLKSIDIVSTYIYDTVDAMKISCDSNKTEEQQVNAKNIYVKYQVTCDEEKKSVVIEKLYDTEKSMAEPSIKEMLSYIYDYIGSDGKFDLDGWKEDNTKDGYVCK